MAKVLSRKNKWNGGGGLMLETDFDEAASYDMRHDNVTVMQGAVRFTTHMEL
jgi:hypothetical protein